MINDHVVLDLTHFLYRSNAKPALTDDDIEDIVAVAIARNDMLQLTGCLHVEDGLIFQWLEGPREALDQVIASIRADERHSDIVDLSYGPLTGRRFSDWRMRSSNRYNASLLDWFAENHVPTVDRGAYVGSVIAFLTAVPLSA